MSVVVPRVADTAIKSIISPFVKHILLFLTLQMTQGVGLKLHSRLQLSRPVRVLFDNGSQPSYITEVAQSQLKLKPVQKERLHLNTFGDYQFKS